MGKVADNEQLKLRATRLNKASVGLFVGGFVIPFAWVIAAFMRWRAASLLKEIKD